jgi:predicted glutamine amidotransferase
MCGIWGLLSAGKELGRSAAEEMVQQLLVLSESRGKEAAGVAMTSQTGISVFKRATAASHMVRAEAYHAFWKQAYDETSSSFAAIGHSRLVTNGSALHPDNNQPVAGHGLVTVHNGILVNVDDLWKNHPELTRHAEVDTEAFVALLESYQKTDGLNQAVRRTYDEIFGMASTLNLFAGCGRFVAATNNGSLYYVFSRSGQTAAFASESLTLARLIRANPAAKRLFDPTGIKQLRAGEALSLTLSDMERQDFRFDDKNVHSAPEASREIEILINQDPRPAYKAAAPEILPAVRYKPFEIDQEPIMHIRRCTRCVLPETMPFIEFDDEGVCNYCRTYEKQHVHGEAALRNWADRMRGDGKKADSIVSFSGGRDSSYGLHYFVRELGLNPVAFTYDWGMVTDLARRNQSRMCAELGVELVLVSADIRRKRENIRKNVSAWLKKPDLGMVPLFMAGDKQYFYYANKTRKAYELSEVLMASNPYEKTHFKSGFCGVKPAVLQKGDKGELEQLPLSGVFRMAGHYLGQYATNPGYINSSLLDTAGATASYYMIPHHYFRLYSYIPWDEKVIDETLISQYDWETSPDTKSTWRIGDGTAPFYNYIYYLVAGFSENDTLRSNQIREGMLTREEAITLIERDNRPRFDSMQWYFDAIGLDMAEALKIIAKIPRLYEK